MPRVPVLDGPGIRQDALRTPQQTAPDVSSGLNALAQGVGQLGEVFERKAMRDAADEAFKIETQVRAAWLDADSVLRQRYRGDNAQGYLEEVDKWWSEQRRTLSGAASPIAQRLIDKNLGSFAQQANASARGYFDGEREKSLDANYLARQTATAQAGAAGIDTTNVTERSAATIKAIDDGVAQYGAVKGWGTERMDAERLARRSAFHTDVVQNLANKSPGAAESYLKANRKDIDATAYAQLEGRLKEVVSAAESFAAVDEVVRKAGGFADGKPIESDKLEAALRAKFEKEPTKARDAISELRSRIQAFNAAENERRAGNVSAVMEAAAGGASIARLRAMPEFSALPGDVKAQIIDRRMATMQAQAGYDLTNLQRAEARLRMKGYDAYLKYSNPETLGSMSEADIVNLSPVLGQDLAGQLMAQKRAQANKDTKLEATIDQQMFDDAAERMGLRPYDPTKSEEQRATLGATKYRVEQLIDKAQQVKKSALTRDEKKTIIDGEISRTVKVPGFLGFGGSDIPVIALSGKDAARVKVPERDAAQIAAALQRAFSQTKNPADAPTEANVRRIYLRSKSMAAEYLPSQAE